MRHLIMWPVNEYVMWCGMHVLWLMRLRLFLFYFILCVERLHLLMQFGSFTRKLVCVARNIHEILRSMKCKTEKKKKKKSVKENNHIRQYLHGLTIFLLPQSCNNFTIQREKNNTRCDNIVFFLKTNTHQTLIWNNSFSILHTRFTVGLKRAKIFHSMDEA